MKNTVLFETIYSFFGLYKNPEYQIAFISGGASSNDVKQSQYLGDCYFVSALSVLASDDAYLRGSFVPPRRIYLKLMRKNSGE